MDDDPCEFRAPSRFGGIWRPDRLGAFLHRREPIVLDRGAPGARPAVLYSVALFDLDEGPVTIALPRAGRRQMTLTAMDERHALQAVFHGPGAHRLNRRRLGAGRVMAVFCLMLGLEQADELDAAHALQDAIRIRRQPRRGPQPRRWISFQAPLAP